GFIMVRSRLVDVAMTIDPAPNDFAIVGGATTVTVAVFDGNPVPDSLELIGPVVLFLIPAVVPVTVNVIVQLAPAARVPPVNVSVLLPLIVRAPPRGVVVSLRAVTPACRVSVNATPVCAAVHLGLVIVRRSADVAAIAIVPAPKDFAIVGGVTTVIVAVFDADPVPPSVELIGP